MLHSLTRGRKDGTINTPQTRNVLIRVMMDVLGVNNILVDAQRVRNGSTSPADRGRARNHIVLFSQVSPVQALDHACAYRRRMVPYLRSSIGRFIRPLLARARQSFLSFHFSL